MDHRLLWKASKIYNRLPNNRFFTKMDPILKLYIYNHIIEDEREEMEKIRTHGILVGSFTDPEAARKMSNSNVIETSDEEFDNSFKVDKEFFGEKQPEKMSKKKRKLINRRNNG